MTAPYLPIDLPASQEDLLLQRLAAARLDVITAKTPERLREVADEIASIELETKEI